MKSQDYWHDPETGAVLSDSAARTYGIDVSMWTKVTMQTVSMTPRAPPESVHAITTLNDDLVAILGRPNFSCIRLAQALRLCGTEIKTKAEHEQAAVIHFLLMRYMSHSSDWAKRADADLREMLDQVDASNKAALQSAEAKGGCHGK